MKGCFILLLCLLSFVASATIRTVSNHPSTLAQFNTIQAAVNASASGDTVLIHGSPVSYAGFTINDKKICFLGPGRNPNLIPGFTATVNGAITITGTLASGTEIHGLNLTTTVNINTPIPSNISFLRNYSSGGVGFGATGTYTGYIFRGNFFYSNGSLFGNAASQFQDFIIENNLIRNNSIYFMSNFSNCLNVFIHHNLFFNPANDGNNVFFSCSGLTLVNNIFNERNICPPQGLSSSVFINNITWNPPDSSTNETPWTCGGNIDGGGNIADMNPMMVDQEAVDNGSAGPLHNFSISSGPANNSGSDGKDMGLLFDTVGELNWNNSRNARLPSVVTMNIANPVIGAGDSLEVTVEARKNE